MPVETVKSENELKVLDSILVEKEGTDIKYFKTLYAEVLSTTYAITDSDAKVLKTLLGNSCFRIGNEEREVDETYSGKIVRFDTTPYSIGDSTTKVNHITVVAIGSENPMEIANNQLKRNRASVLVNGKPSVKFNLTPVDETTKVDENGNPITE